MAERDPLSGPVSDLMTVACRMAGCTNVITCPRRDPGPALRRVDWEWDGAAAACRDCPPVPTGPTGPAVEHVPFPRELLGLPWKTPGPGLGYLGITPELQQGAGQ